MSTYTIHKFKGSEIRVSKKTGVGKKYWATAWSGMVAEDGSTRQIALRKAKRKILNYMKNNKRR